MRGWVRVCEGCERGVCGVCEGGVGVCEGSVRGV